MSHLGTWTEKKHVLSSENKTYLEKKAKLQHEIQIIKEKQNIPNYPQVEILNNDLDSLTEKHLVTIPKHLIFLMVLGAIGLMVVTK